MDTTDNGMMEAMGKEMCPSCGAMNGEAAKVCDGCGKPMPVEKETNSAHPKDNLVRARFDPKGVEMRAAEGGDTPSELYGYFSQFGKWYEVDSLWEGQFMERIMPGAFADTIANDRSNMRVLFDHGMDPHLGSATLGPISVLEERAEGPYYEVKLLDTDYNRDRLIPQLSGRLMDGTTVGSQLGASFRFQVQDETWNRKPKADRYNPNALPERSITRAKVFEFGPVTFPANAAATAGVRSLSDEWMARLAGDKGFMRDFSERVGSKVAQRVLAAVPDDLRAAMQAKATPSRQEQLKRRARAILTVGSL